MKFYFNEEDYGILPGPVKEELKKICVSYCMDVGGIITLSFRDDHKLLIRTMEPIDEIGSELKIKQMRASQEEFFSKLEEFSRAFFPNEGEA